MTLINQALFLRNSKVVVPSFWHIVRLVTHNKINGDPQRIFLFDSHTHLWIWSIRVRENREMSFGLLYETVIIMMMTTTTLRCISSQNFCSVWLVRQFLTSSSSPMNFGNDIEVTDKLSLQMSFCCMRRGKTKKHSRENYPDFLTSTFVFPLPFLCFPLHNSIGFSCRNATRMFSSTAHFTQEQKVIIFLFSFQYLKLIVVYCNYFTLLRITHRESFVLHWGSLKLSLFSHLENQRIRWWVI